MKTLQKMVLGGGLLLGVFAVGMAEEPQTWCQPDTIRKVSTSNEGGIYLYTYDNRGNALVTEFCERNKLNGNYIPNRKITSTYNRFDKVETSVVYGWNGSTYMQGARKTSTYDEKGNHITLLNESYGASGWVGESHFTYTYNDKNLKRNALVRVPNATDRTQWVNSEKADYTYDADNRETAYEYYKWSGSMWTPTRSTFSTYENGRLVKESGKGLDVAGNFIDSYESSYTYNAAGKETGWLYRAFNSDSGAWENVTKRATTYNEQNLKTEYYSYSWSAIKKDWEAKIKEKYTYNDKGLLAKVEQYAQVENAEEWTPSITIEYTYNASGRRTAYTWSDHRDGSVKKYEFTLNDKNDDVRAVCYKQQGNTWVPTDVYNLELQWHDGSEVLYANSPAMHEMTVHYKSGVKGPIANENRQTAPAFTLRAYPNPARDVLHVSVEEQGCYTIELLDMSGRRVAVRHGVQNADFNVEEHHGVYILRVEKNGVAAAAKVVVL